MKSALAKPLGSSTPRPWRPETLNPESTEPGADPIGRSEIGLKTLGWLTAGSAGGFNTCDGRREFRSRWEVPVERRTRETGEGRDFAHQ